jgi:hypothetical protein
MPHLPDSQHPDHDLELIAAYAAGDATGPELDRATALVASCTDCAALHHDLRSIAAVMPAMPAPARTRDFRLTAEQAAELRPKGIRGFLATLSGPKFSFATPVGTGLAALGIVGVLVASGGLPVGSGGTAAPQPESAALEAPGAVASPAPEAQGAYAAGAQPAASAAASAGSDTSGEVAPAPSDVALKAAAEPAATQTTAIEDGANGARASTIDAAASSPWLGVAILLVFVGAALVAARLVARRLAGAP